MKEERGINIGGVSLWFTGNGIFERSFPMQFLMMDHRLRRFGGLSRMISLLFAMVGFQSTLKLGTGPVGVCICTHRYMHMENLHYIVCASNSQSVHTHTHTCVHCSHASCCP